MDREKVLDTLNECCKGFVVTAAFLGFWAIVGLALVEWITP